MLGGSLIAAWPCGHCGFKNNSWSKSLGLELSLEWCFIKRLSPIDAQNQALAIYKSNR